MNFERESQGGIQPAGIMSRDDKGLMDGYSELDDGYVRG